jgi:hypothetical protein
MIQLKFKWRYLFLLSLAVSAAPFFSNQSYCSYINVIIHCHQNPKIELMLPCDEDPYIIYRWKEHGDENTMRWRTREMVKRFERKLKEVSDSKMKLSNPSHNWWNWHFKNILHDHKRLFEGLVEFQKLQISNTTNSQIG